ncbi:ABC transporter ATP-binding protein [Bacillus haimaensis]|uniref:ABC transporter ATP-binding protein n=1 Tax=Bacillus haimaensis TaxID=3160967 RepID=UPI003AA9BEB8
MSRILEIKQLTAGFRTDNGIIKAIDDVTFSVERGKTVCIVGESGSGKSVTSLSILRLIEFENGMILNGEMNFEGENLVQKSNEEMCKIRGGQISMIFQEPMTALNPVFTIGKQICEAIRYHKKSSKAEAMKRARELLQLVGMSEPDIRLKQYPHELSGGMRQRAMIAMALASDPKLLIADEPTTALDVTIQSQILTLLQDLKEKLNMSILLITHDIGVAAEMSDRVVVMYAGKVLEEGSVYDIFDKPLHPYTIGLLRSIPTTDGDRTAKLPSIKGGIPNLTDMPTGCRFHPRCEYATSKCKQVEPPLERANENRRIACWHYEAIANKEAVLTGGR